VTPVVIDAERLGVVRALRDEPATTVQPLTRHYDEGFGDATCCAAVSTTPVHGAVRAPPSADHRYLTEDVPYRLVPIVEIGEALGLLLPVARGLVHVVDAFLASDSIAIGHTAEALGLSGLDAAGMPRYAMEGLR
jgi:opine dehydrogenase